jgi:pilus assembly protein CpaF
VNATYYLVIGAKGGCGATTFTVDLAKAVRRARRAVVVVDADLSGRRAVAELLGGTRQLNAIRGHEVHSVANVEDIEIVELVSKYEDVAALVPAELEVVASRIGEVDGIVLVDVPRPLEHYVAPFVRRATRAIVIMEPDMLGSSAARTTVTDLTRFGIPLERLWLVVNDRNKKQAISTRELESLLGIPVVAELPRNNVRPYERVLDSLARRMLDAPDEMPFLRLPSLARFATPQSGVRLRRKSDQDAGAQTAGREPAAGTSVAVEAAQHHKTKRDRVRREISDLMMTRVDLIAASAGHTDGEKFAHLRDTIEGLIKDIVASRNDINDFTLQDHAEMKQEILDEQLGLGPLEDLMRDPTVSEIMVNGPKKIYIERNGKLTLSDRAFSNNRQLRLVIERIVAPLGRRIDESSPMVDARLPDGSRVNAIIEPLSLKGATLTIRRFGTKRLVIDDLVRLGSLPQQAVVFLKAIIEARLNVVVSGGTGTGKTTFLNILSNFIPNDERIVTIEDAAELSLNQEHVVSLESRPMNIEGRGEVTVRELVKNSLRMRPDRIVVGECRGGEALDMLQAMNTGHDGSLTTLHANSPRDALARMETLVMMAGFDLPIQAIREQIASAVDIIVQIERMRDGTRKIINITEVIGMNGSLVMLQDIVKYQSRGLDSENAVTGAFQSTGVVPHFLKRFEEMGVPFDPSILEGLEHAYPVLPVPALNGTA